MYNVCYNISFISSPEIIMKFLNKDWKEVKRTECLIYTRVMWYLSPTYRYNLGKKSEFFSRKYFSQLKAENHDFNKKYLSI